MVNRVINGVYGRRTKRLYLRLNPCQYAGLELLAHRSGRSPGEAGYAFILDELERMRTLDTGFRNEWDRACRPKQLEKRDQ